MPSTPLFPRLSELIDGQLDDVAHDAGIAPVRLRRIVEWAWPFEYERASLALVLDVPEGELFALDPTTQRLVDDTTLDPAMSARVVSIMS